MGLNGPFAPQQTRNLDVTTVPDNVPDNADAVIMNVTATGPTAGGWLTLFPAGTSLPTASNLNFTANQTVPNLVVVKVGKGANDGLVSINNTGGNSLAGSVNVIADVVGYYRDAKLPADASFVGVDPTRILDTRFNQGLTGPFTPQQTRKLDVANAPEITPPAGAVAVVLNVTATGSSAAGWLTLFPAEATLPTASNLNFLAGQTVPNLVTVKLGTGGADAGKVAINNTGGNAGAGTVNVIADVVGYFAPVGQTLQTFAPQRILDTRTGLGGFTGPVAPQDIITVDPDTATLLPATCRAAVVNVTATGGSRDGWLTVFPSTPLGPPPTASNLNFVAGQTVPNLVMVRTGTDELFKIANTFGNVNAGTVNIIVDIVGCYI